MLNLVWQAHSGNRYLVLFAGLDLAVVSLAGMVGANIPLKLSRILGAIFAGLLDLQLLLGVVLFALGHFGTQVLGHAVAMVLAVALAHVMHVLAKKRPEEAHRWRLAGSVGPLVLITVGIFAIGRGLLQHTVGAY